ncbi:coagulation factor III, tissue factor a [Clarias gariepinus]|uniref:coagulation factor IIIa n=1 Tax=Clarias gariepinus TaxID=13013 RepID=UPI00234C9BFE|nr:coagulation factor IIIa [Clarias gariepinus]
MKSPRSEKPRSFMSVWLLLVLSAVASGSFPTAQNVTWVSVNFKTLLTWDPKPTNYSYTVEFSKFGENNQRIPHCIRMSQTECDLTAGLTDLKSKYEADVVSEPLRDMSSDLIEFPRTASEQFCPYQDTIIGSPQFTIDVSKDKQKITIIIEDIPTAVLNAQNQMRTIQDIFKNDLQYKVTYNKAQSTGKKEKTRASNQIELTDLDKGESYCFTVQVLIPSRNINKQLGERSQVKCSPGDDINGVFSPAVIAGGTLAILVIIAVVIAVIIICCKQKEEKNRGKERVPLKGV